MNRNFTIQAEYSELVLDALTHSMSSDPLLIIYFAERLAIEAVNENDAKVAALREACAREGPGWSGPPCPQLNASYPSAASPGAWATASPRVEDHRCRPEN